MGNNYLFHRIEELVIEDKKFVATLTSYLVTFLIVVNLAIIRSPILGVASSLTYLLMNGMLIGQAVFKKEKPFVRLILGGLLLICFLSLVSWAIMISYSLDDIRSTLVLFIVATISSIINKFETNRPTR